MGKCNGILFPLHFLFIRLGVKKPPVLPGENKKALANKNLDGITKVKVCRPDHKGDAKEVFNNEE